METFFVDQLEQMEVAEDSTSVKKESEEDPLYPLEQIKVAENSSDVKKESEGDPLTGRKLCAELITSKLPRLFLQFCHAFKNWKCSIVTWDE